MILTELFIQGYKHYHGEHRIEPPAQGIVAIIGANGVGKTTLFEAIEWCLYNPREIENAEVPPRGGVGQTRVRVTFEDPRDGARYVVERSLKRGAASAEVYREDQQESPIVQGSRQVTEYVARQLVGLSHRAFVSTFFTRQKELSFFGNLKPTDRRVEVGRLLGLETIREAQRLIGDDRAHARAEATSFAHQYTEQSAGRDFAAELVAADEGIAAQEGAAVTATARLAAATETYSRARAELDRCRDLERRDEALARELERVGGDERAANARLGAADAALLRLDDLIRTRATLAPLAAAESERAATVAVQEAEQARATHLRQLETDRKRAERVLDDATREIRRSVDAIGGNAVAIADWPWSAVDDADSLAAADRRIALAGGLDVDNACKFAVGLAECRRRVEERDAALLKRDRYRERRRQIEREHAELLGAGDPDAAMATARATREAALQEATTAASEAATAARTREQLKPLAAALRAQRFEDRCPTCARPFSPHEADLIGAALEDRIEGLTSEEATARRRQQAATARSKSAEQAEAAATARIGQLATLNGRLTQAQPAVADAEQTYERAEWDLAAEMERHGFTEEPTPERLIAAQTRADLVQRIANTVPLLRRLGRDARRATADVDESRAAVASLGPVAYEPAAHAAATAALIESREAAARIAQLDQELAHRPGHETARAAAAADLERLAADRARLGTDRAALGFDATVRVHAAATEEAALTAERAAAAAQNAAQTALRQAITERETLRKDQARIAGLAARSESRGREADELERMYREFTRFDQYVAGRVTPQLAEHTGELLGAITDGKYDRVQFDENYGLTIYDDDEPFPVDAFSGGERDVAALCARLALSRLVGGQAAHPPGFLVLDEVFGSLDQDRRAQVLSTLALLATSTDAFRQLFIISHVEDVRLSSIFDEVWRITEVDGASRVENLTRVGGVEEL